MDFNPGALGRRQVRKSGIELEEVEKGYAAEQMCKNAFIALDAPESWQWVFEKSVLPLNGIVIWEVFKTFIDTVEGVGEMNLDGRFIRP